MSLLPRTHAQFRQTDYWDGFFRRRGRRAFEWYGEYGELCGVLHKYCRPSEKVLIVGCGNSTLSADLYDVGYRGTVSIDLSEVVIRQMRAQHARDRPDLRFDLVDVTNMGEHFKDGEFSCAIDKGTLDAIFTSNDQEVVSNVEKMLKEIGRVLRVGGRYICISLLQPHILEYLVKFCETQGWPLRLVRCKEAEANRRPEDTMFPVFAVVATKLKKMEGMPQVFEMAMSSGGQVNRLTSGSDLINSVRGVQQFAAARAGALRTSAGGNRLFDGADARQEEVALELRASGEEEPKYSLYLAQKSGHKEGRIKFAVFIVPQGRETEWLFSTSKGRTQLADSASSDHLVVAHLNRAHDFAGGMEAVKNELSAHVMELAPPDLPADNQVPFLSLSDDGGVGSRRERSRGKSQMSGEFVVEDVDVDGESFRRLVFLSNPNLTQSEARLKSVKGKNKKTKKVVDPSYLACAHHSLMVGALGLFPNDKKVRILLVGLGGGGLAMYLAQHIKRAHVDVVEIDPTMAKVAREDFGFRDSDRLNLIIADGLEYIRTFGGEGYHLVMFDVDSKDSSVGMSCPPKQFVAREMLEVIREKCLLSNGVFVLNLVCRDEELREETVSRLGDVFGGVASYKVPLEVNEVLYCAKKDEVLLNEAGKVKSKKKIDQSSPMIVAYKAVNDEVRSEDFISITESLKNLQILH